jgi:hypothetical protein
MIPGAFNSTLCLLEDLRDPRPSMGFLENNKLKSNFA